MHKEQTDVGWCHARNAAGLADGIGANGFEFLTGFGQEAFHGVVIKIGRNRAAFHPFEARNFRLLTFQVAIIFDLDLQLLAYLFHRPGFQLHLADEPVHIQGFGLSYFLGVACFFQMRAILTDQRAVAFQRLIGIRADQSDAVAVIHQAQIGIVRAQLQTVFGAGGEHAIRFIHPFGHQVINQNANISFIAF